MATIKKYTLKNGKTNYHVVIRLRGEKTLCATFTKLTQAKIWAQDTESNIKLGRHIQMPESKKHTLEELVNDYIRHEIPKRKSEQDKYVKQLEWWKNKLGTCYLSNITPAKLSECKRLLETEPSQKPKNGRTTRTGATVNRYLMILSSVFSYACEELNWLDENPMHKVRKNTEKPNKERYLSKDEISRMLEACDKFNIRTENYNKETRLFILIALTTGARYSEIMNLKWENVDLKHRKFYFMDTKNGENRGVPMSEDVLKGLEKFRKVRKINNNSLWATKDGKKLIDMRVRFYKVLELAKIKNFRFHDLRHTAASYLAMNGAQLIDIAAILGHKTMQMVKRYSHLTEKHTGTLIETAVSDMFSAVK